MISWSVLSIVNIDAILCAKWSTKGNDLFGDFQGLIFKGWFPRRNKLTLYKFLYKLNNIVIFNLSYPLAQVFPPSPYKEWRWCMVSWPAPIIVASRDAQVCTMPGGKRCKRLGKSTLLRFLQALIRGVVLAVNKAKWSRWMYCHLRALHQNRNVVPLFFNLSLTPAGGWVGCFLPTYLIFNLYDVHIVLIFLAFIASLPQVQF